jgi:hypothetical protein
MTRISVGLLLFVWAGMALAIRPSEVRSRMEASMLVSGEIAVDAQGGVTRYELDHRDQLPDGVERYLDAQIADWLLDPAMLEGQPVAVRNRMDLLLVATPAEDGKFRMALRNASFHPMKQAGYGIERIAVMPPLYPRVAAESGVSGTVYLALRIGADGSVVEAMAEQVNLRIVLSDPEMKRWRGVLARNAIEAARKWTFRLPSKGGYSGAWDVRVPVAYALHDQGADLERVASESYGKWDSYIPGPRQPIPWRADVDDAPLEVLANGGIYPIGQDDGRPKLAQPADAGGG